MALLAVKEKLGRFYGSLRMPAVMIARELKRNFARSRPLAIVDVVILAVCAALFYMNRCILIPCVLTETPANFLGEMLSSHGNDLLGGVAFLAYVNLLISLVKPEFRLKRLASMLAFIFLCGLFWEYAAPLFVANSVSDPLDLATYMIGAFVYWLIFRATISRAENQPS